MRVAEFIKREDFLPVLTQTVAKGWSLRLGQAFKVTAPAKLGEQSWLIQPTLSACYVADPAPRVRAFLRDSICFSPRLERVPFQLALGVGLASRWGLRFAGDPCFSTHPSVPRAHEILIVPGNLRVRIYDFGAGRCLVVRKEGFEMASMRREIEAREKAEGISLPLLARADDHSWFEEPIMDGYALSRLPPWLSRAQVEAKLFRRLDAWAAPGIRSQSAQAWVQQRLLSLRSLAARLPAGMRHASSRLHIFAEALAEVAAELPDISLAPTHGDMQAGNVLVRRDGRDFSIIDWEHWGERFSYYDRMVYGLGARAYDAIVGRARSFLRLESKDFALESLPASRRWRRAAVAAFLLEDLLWFTDENLRGPFGIPSAGWMRRIALKDPLLALLRSSA